MKTSFSRRELYAFGETLGDSVTRQVAGRRIYGAGGVANTASSVMPTNTATNTTGTTTPTASTTATPFSSASATPAATSSVLPQSQTDTQSGVAGYAQPYVDTMLGATMQNLFNYDEQGNATGMKGYTPYSYNPADYVAGFSPLQQQSQQGIASLQAPNQTQQAAQYANQATQGLLNAQYTPQTAGYNNVSAPALQQYQMSNAPQVTAQTFGQQSADQYMSPYMQSVVNIQQREAQRQADIASTQRGAQAAQQGAFGGSRQAIMDAEAARNLATQKGDIQAQGLQSAYTQAQAQFNADQQAKLAAQQANQQAGLTTGAQNLAANLTTQNLGAGQNLQSQQLNQAANLQAQQLAAQQQQFGANYGLQGLQSALTGANTLSGLGTTGLNNQLNVLNAQQQAGLTQQQQQQNIINQGVQNYQTAQQYPMTQLTNMKNMLTGLPISTTSTQQYQAAPSTVSQLAGLGMAGIGLNQLMGATGGTAGTTGTAGSSGVSSLGGLGSLVGGLNSLGSSLGNAASTVGGWLGLAEGGQVKDNAGLAHLAISKME